MPGSHPSEPPRFACKQMRMASGGSQQRIKLISEEYEDTENWVISLHRLLLVIKHSINKVTKARIYI